MYIYWPCYVADASMFAFSLCVIFPGQLCTVECWREFVIEAYEQNVDGTVGAQSSPLSIIFFWNTMITKLLSACWEVP